MTEQSGHGATTKTENLDREIQQSVYSPVQVKSADGNSYLTDIIEIAAGSNHNLALA